MAIRHLGGNSRGGDMTEAQVDKYITHNDHIDLLADATQQKMNLYVGISTGNTLFLGLEDFTENFVFHLRAEPGSPSLDGDFVLQVPAIMRNFAVMNDTGFVCYVESAGSPGGQAEVPDGGRAHLHSDGESIEEIKRDVYDIFAFVNVVNFDARIVAMVSTRSWKLPADLVGSFAYAYVASGGGENDRIISIQKNEVEQGTITFAALDQDGTLSFASDVTFAPGDRFLMQWASEESPDTAITLADVIISLKGILL